MTPRVCDRRLGGLLVGALAAATMLLLAASEPAGQESNAAPGSIARQLMLKYRLQKIADGTLSDSLRHNRRQWESLSPDQRQKYRREQLAFFQASPGRQEALLKEYDNLSKLSGNRLTAYQKRAGWLKVVVASFTPDQRKALSVMEPKARAERLIKRRDELVRQGRLLQQAPQTQPACTQPSQPTTSPAAR